VLDLPFQPWNLQGLEPWKPWRFPTTCIHPHTIAPTPYQDRTSPIRTTDCLSYLLESLLFITFRLASFSWKLAVLRIPTPPRVSPEKPLAHQNISNARHASTLHYPGRVLVPQNEQDAQPWRSFRLCLVSLALVFPLVFIVRIALTHFPI